MGMKAQLAVLLLILALPLAAPLGAHEEGFPEKTLKAVFPDASGFTAREKTFTADQVKEIEKAAASRLAGNDNPLHFYVALGKPSDGSGVLGIVVMADADGPKGDIDLALGVKRDGTIARVVISANADEKGLSAAAFLDQFKGKTAQSPLALGKDITYAGNAKSAEAVLSAVRRGLQMLAVAGRK
jgi:Na+-translocating ferredoxin:NAD+ oxidoreductase RnfG subunit